MFHFAYLNFKKITFLAPVLLILCLFFFSASSNSYAQVLDTGDDQGSAFLDTGDSPSGSSTTPAAQLQNPLAGTIDSLPDLVKELLNIVLIIGTPIVALAIIFAGFMLVAAQGNPEKLQKARSALLWAIVGGAVLLGSYILAQAIGGSVNELIAP